MLGRGGGGGAGIGRSSSVGLSNNAARACSSGAPGIGISFGEALRAEVSTVPILIASGRRDSAGPSAMK